MEKLLLSTNYSAKPEPYIRDKITTFKVRNPTLSYFSQYGGVSNSYKPHVYDLYEYGRIMDVESFVTRAFAKKRTLMFKEGYTINSSNEANITYIKKRLSEIGFVTGKSFDEFIRELGFNLIAFHNSYIVKVRSLKSSSGRVRMIGKTSAQPIAGYFILPPESVEVRVDDSGTPIAYRQRVTTGKYVEYSAASVVHLHYNKRTGFVMGTPPLEPVKDDILALRRIEESIETLIYKSLFPIIHVKVGTDKMPAKKFLDGTSEVEIATAYLDKMEDDGGIVTSERVDIKSIGAESLALRVESYLNHFKERVFVGLGMSGIDLGIGDSTGRATGEVLSESIKESVIDYQYTLEEFISQKIFLELLCESGRYPNEYEIDEKNRVLFTFNDLDVSGMIKKESHALNKMTQGVQGINETRSYMRLKNLTDKEVASMTKQLKFDPNKQVTGAIAAKGSSSGTKKSKSSNLTKSIAKPTNQHSDHIDIILNIIYDSDNCIDSRVFNVLSSYITDEYNIDTNNNKVSDFLITAANNIISNKDSFNIDSYRDFVEMQLMTVTHTIMEHENK